MIKACIFDLDGTLADTIDSIAYAGNKALEATGFALLPVENYKYYAGDGAKTLVERALYAAGDTSLTHLEEAFACYSSFFKTDCTYKVTVFEGINELLTQLKASGIKLAVLSNKPHERTLEVIQKLFGEHIFDHVQGQMETVPKKPDPAGALMIAESFGVLPSECLYIGDTNVDMQTGKRAGMYTAGVLWGFRLRSELEENHADAIVAHPSEIALLAENIR